MFQNILSFHQSYDIIAHPKGRATPHTSGQLRKTPLVGCSFFLERNNTYESMFYVKGHFGATVLLNIVYLHSSRVFKHMTQLGASELIFTCFNTSRDIFEFGYFLKMSDKTLYPCTFSLLQI